MQAAVIIVINNQLHCMHFLVWPHNELSVW